MAYKSETHTGVAKIETIEKAVQALFAKPAQWTNKVEVPNGYKWTALDAQLGAEETTLTITTRKSDTLYNSGEWKNLKENLRYPSSTVIVTVSIDSYIRTDVTDENGNNISFEAEFRAAPVKTVNTFYIPNIAQMTEELITSIVKLQMGVLVDTTGAAAPLFNIANGDFNTPTSNVVEA